MAYGGWPNCFRVSNGEVELIVTSDVGPRILRYGFVGGQNLFLEIPEELGKTGEKKFAARGGHRIWVAPEHRRDTYAADNGPVTITTTRGVLTASAPVEPATGFMKSIRVKMSSSGSAVEVTHSITHTAATPRTISAWALTMMAPGGTGIHGLPPRGTHPEVLLPTNPLGVWAFTDLSDRRWRFTKKYIVLKQDRQRPGPQKIGSFNKKTFGAYLLRGNLFIKRYTADPHRAFPDFGCSFEMFTNERCLELETLGPLQTLAAGESVRHVERWSLHRNVKISTWSDQAIDEAVLPLV